MDVDTRLLRYFAAVAAEGNLTRAAERLFVSQPALTRQIKQLESQLGVRLFTRSRMGMTLTEAGQALAETTPAVLAGWDLALRETKATASCAARVLRVGFISSAANEATQQIIAAFARRRPGWRVDMQQAAWSDPTAGLASGDVDAALLRLPFPGQDDVRIEVLPTEPRWVALPTTHPLAARDQISFHQLWDEPFVAAPAETGWWRDYWLATDAPAPRLVDVKELAETVRASGTPVDLQMSGTDRSLSPALELSVYRVIQEALTNVVKHAPGARATVDLAVCDHGIRLDVTDDGGPARHPAGGQWQAGPSHGIVGMRERIAAFGGRLVAGPLAGRGFRVTAQVPIEGAV